MYMAPELLLNIQKGTTYSDMWALGCTLIEVFKEELTWSNELFEDTIHNILRKRLVPSVDTVPHYLRDILLACFDYNPFGRPTADEIHSCLPPSVFEN